MTDALAGRGLDLPAIQKRLDAATPGPWTWGTDWSTLDYQGPDGGGDKYADLQLRGADGTEIIPVRIDHYEPIWDCEDPDGEPKYADRQFIAHAPEDVAALLGALREMRAELQFALDATTVGPVKWLVPTKVGDDWQAWCVRAARVLETVTDSEGV